MSNKLKRRLSGSKLEIVPPPDLPDLPDMDPYFVYDLEPTTMMDPQSPDPTLPLVVRNKRGRKVDETLPKSHQREVQRQFRARRASHLLDLERRVSLLERENFILRHWAGVLPANRSLLGRGPTGCDITKPLIADDNDPEIHLEKDDASPRDRSWPPASAVPPARAPYPQEQSDGVGSMNQSAQATTTQQTMISDSPIVPTAAPVFENQGFESSPFPDTRKFKLHPLYGQNPIFGDYPTHVSNFDQVPALAVDRLLIKRESVYAPPTPAAMSSLLSQRTDIPPHDYYSSQSRPSFSRQANNYPSQSLNSGHAEMNGSNAAIGTNYYPAHLVSWPDTYASAAPQSLGRRQPPSTLIPLTPVVPPAGLTSSPVSFTSPSQPTSATGSVPDQRSSTISSESMYSPRRSVNYVNGIPTGSGTPASLSSSTFAQAQPTMYSHHTDGAQSQQQLHLHQQQQQRQRQYHDGNANPDSFQQ